MKIDLKNLPPTEASSYMEHVKSLLPRKDFEDFFETEVLVLYIPVKNETSIEIHEIILNDLGYDKYNMILKDNNLNIKTVLDNIKELIDGSDKE